MVNAHAKPIATSCGVTCNSAATALPPGLPSANVLPLRTAHDTAAPTRPPIIASNMDSTSTDNRTLEPGNPIARNVAISRLRALTDEYMVFSAPNQAPVAMIAPIR